MSYTRVSLAVQDDLRALDAFRERWKAELRQKDGERALGEKAEFSETEGEPRLRPLPDGRQ